MPLTIISRAQWGASKASSVTSYHLAITRWFTHYVGSYRMWRTADFTFVVPTVEQSMALMRSLQEDAMDEGYTDFEYNFAIDPAGRIFEGRGWVTQSGATYHANEDSWSVVYLGGPDTPLTNAAKAAFSALTRDGARRSSTLQSVLPHKRVYATACPGIMLTAFTDNVLTHHLRDPEIDWDALAVLAAWLKRVSTPTGILRYTDRGKDVKIMNDLLILHGSVMAPGDAYGAKSKAAVHAFKLRHHLPNANGERCGALCANALLFTTG